MRTTVNPAHFRSKKNAFLVRGMSNRHSDIRSDIYEFLEQPEEAAPFLKGVLIALLPALLCWAGIIGVVLKFWRQFSH